MLTSNICATMMCYKGINKKVGRLDKVVCFLDYDNITINEVSGPQHKRERERERERDCQA